MNSHIEIVRVGPDPFGRGELTVFYRDLSIRREAPEGAKVPRRRVAGRLVAGRIDSECEYITFDTKGERADEVYYLWVVHWPAEWPPLPS